MYTSRGKKKIKSYEDLLNGEKANMGRLIVPSDISLLEDKYTVAPRQLSLLERWGSGVLFPVFNLGYRQHDRHTLRRILSKNFGCPGHQITERDQLVLEILRTRQASVQRRVRSNAIAQAGALLGGTLSYTSIRFYDVKTKCIVMPFATCISFFIGHVVGQLWTGRYGEFYRDRFLGELSPKQFYMME